MKTIFLNRVTKIYRKGFKALKIPAVLDLTVSVESGRITGFVGPNGAGKTTTIKMIMGLVTPSSGQVTVQGCPSSDPQARRGIAFVSEQPYLYRHLTIDESLWFAARLSGVNERVLRNEIARVVKLLELDGRERVKVCELSKGLAQRLNMACALLGDPHTLILDEPMSGMDPPGRLLFRNIFRDLIDKGKTVFFSTHVLEDIESICDEVIVIAKGKLEYKGSVEELCGRGRLGTEMTITLTAGELPEAIWSMGCRLEQRKNEDSLLFVPSGLDVQEVQRILYDQNIFCKEIRPRSMPLERLLYGGGLNERLTSMGEHMMSGAAL